MKGQRQACSLGSYVFYFLTKSLAIYLNRNLKEEGRQGVMWLLGRECSRERTVCSKALKQEPQEPTRRPAKPPLYPPQLSSITFWSYPTLMEDSQPGSQSFSPPLSILPHLEQVSHQCSRPFQKCCSKVLHPCQQALQLCTRPHGYSLAP